MVFKELIFNQFLVWDGGVVLKELILSQFLLWGFGTLDRTDF